MKKSDLITQFSLYRGEASSALEAESATLLLFAEEYPIANFGKWNTELDDEWAQSFLLRHRDDPDCDLRWLVAGLWQVG